MRKNKPNHGGCFSTIIAVLLLMVLYACPEKKQTNSNNEVAKLQVISKTYVTKDTVLKSLDSITDFGNVELNNYTMFGLPVYAENKVIKYDTVNVNYTSLTDNAKAFSVASTAEKLNNGNEVYIKKIKANKPNNVVFFGQNIKDGLVNDIEIDSALQSKQTPKSGAVILKFDNAWSDSLDLRKLTFDKVVIKNSYLKIDSLKGGRYLVGMWLSSGVNNYHFKYFKSDLPLRIAKEPSDPAKSTGNHIFDYCYLEKKRSYCYHSLYNSHFGTLILDNTNTTYINDSTIDTLYYKNTEIKVTNSVIKFKQELE